MQVLWELYQLMNILKMIFLILLEFSYVKQLSMCGTIPYTCSLVLNETKSEILFFFLILLSIYNF